MFRIISEFVDAIDTMSGITKGASIFGSARVKPDNEGASRPRTWWKPAFR
ncbi:hypothetical protein DFAR_1530009 [Desulfarculales bacterium]